MARENVKTVVKSYDTDTINGWAVNYTHESENGNAPEVISVSASKEGAHVSVSKSAANTSISFGTVVDNDLLVAILAELETIANVSKTTSKK